ncbi:MULTISPECIES: hypothetical protein [unclassified Clostridioides]|uniref:hypothetical protein n=1 Tax=unclassified Clostridioides TaxID=2635829 RepID=UPI001D116B9F|nr:hypothetical protein [Clostridioides sp. ES-S-0001-02]MCC0640624.1 hypothetical protein [Clostridioides sp. ES-S-0049-03]MCC0676707.1 hypothetical protein [Clostridioides sp. ES-W-0018-02]MCC0708445.1 hypothetical protein [Clostridioides sp. ES-S-0190-01]MCC0711910.1 hypothetical protein [Clostridioides sp. ES-W-0017-02]
MNNLLFLIGVIALSNGNISIFDDKDKSKKNNRARKNKKNSNEKLSKAIHETLRFDANDIKRGLRLMDLSEEDLEMGMEIITRTKKYMSRDERKILVKIESILDLVRGIKKLNNIDVVDIEEETDFFRKMDSEDKKNMMIKEIIDVFPEKRKNSVEKAIGMKKKIDLFAELFLPDDFGEGGFSLSSLANINNLGSMNNLKLLGNLLRGDDSNNDDEDEYEDSNEEDEESTYEDEELNYEDEIDDNEEELTEDEETDHEYAENDENIVYDEELYDVNEQKHEHNRNEKNTRSKAKRK